MSVPVDRRYTREHEWIQVEGDRGRVGITEYAQEQLGDVVFVELPKVGRQLRAMEAFGVVESVKAVSDLFTPAPGEVIEVNSALEGQPETINRDPYGAGWMIVLKLTAPQEVEGLLDAQAYEAYLRAEGH